MKKTTILILLSILSFVSFGQLVRTDSIINFPSFPICYENNGDKIVWSPNYANAEKCAECTMFWINTNNLNEMTSRTFHTNGNCKSISLYKLALASDRFVWLPNGVWKEFDDNGILKSEEVWLEGVKVP